MKILNFTDMERRIEHQDQLFQNSFLESLTRTKPAVAFTLYPAIALALITVPVVIGQMDIVWAIPIFITGMAAWTLLEYLMHRYLFHIGGDNKIVARFRYMMHGIHHDNPRDKNRLIMPPVPWFLYTSVLLGLFYLILGNYAFAFMPGILIGYCIYIYIHYHIHLPNPPKYLRKNQVHHSLHHYRFHDRAFGVSTTLWDRVFRTMP